MNTRSNTKILAMVALMAAVLCVLSPLSIPIGSIPLTLGVFAVFLTAAMLPPLPALAALAVYVLIGALGLPVFSSFRGGPQMLVGPTGGYFLGYFIIVGAVALCCQKTASYALRMAVSVGALLLFYTSAALWYAFVTNTTIWVGIATCVFPFAIPDTIKAAAALALAAVLRRRLEKAS